MAKKTQSTSVFGGLAIAWYTRETYDWFLANVPDADEMIATYNEWRERANQRVLEFAAEGTNAVRIYIDPKAFPLWCAKRGVPMDGQSRSEYAAEELGRRTEALNSNSQIH